MCWSTPPWEPCIDTPAPSPAPSLPSPAVLRRAVQGRSQMVRYSATEPLLRQYGATIAPLHPPGGWLGAVQVGGGPLLSSRPAFLP